MNTLEKAILHYGIQHQTVVAIEELAELQKELTKALRGQLNRQNIIEEFADVEIMLRQIKYIYAIHDSELVAARCKKVDRLEEQLKNAGY